MPQLSQVPTLRTIQQPHKPKPLAPDDWLTEALARGLRETFCTIATIGPDEAARLLARNTVNRSVAKTNLAKIELDLRHGHWQLNGESIVIARTGELNDGQHRLQAIFNTGVSIQTVVVFGVERDTRVTLDTGRARDLADSLGMRGVHNPALVASTARAIMGYELGKGAGFIRSRDLTVSEMIERAVTDTAIHDAVRYGHLAYCNGGKELLSPTCLSVPFYILSKIDAPAARNYLDRLWLGDQLVRGSAIWTTRRELMLTTTRKRDELLSIIFWGWRHHRDGTMPKSVPIQFPLPELGGILKGG